MAETVIFEGSIIRVITKLSPSGKKLEIATRPPGTRIILHNLNTNQILLNQEIRLDIGADYRLPGGKVRDTNHEWDLIKDSSDLDDQIITAGAKESREECGYELTNPKLFTVSTSGGPTVYWDLYYIVATQFVDLGHLSLEADEKIVPTWYPVEEVKKMCLEGKIREGRSVAAILQYLHSVKQI
ncbi:MAG: hypothetical protein WC851_02250 [Candidatus Shapirobacteria bacterium]|jgi:8-oxo-dGTP pyrophosphatase MutT (NUDIX family)